MAEDILPPNSLSVKEAKKLRDRARTTAWHKAHPERVKEISRAWQKRNQEKECERLRKRRAENPDERKVYDRTYYERHKEKAIKASQTWKEKNPEKIRNKHRRWRKNNPIKARLKRHIYRATHEDKIREYNYLHKDDLAAKQRKRYAKIKSSERHYTPSDIEEMFASQTGQCVYCRVSLKGGFHIDHIMPIARGGSNAKENIQLLCKRCNVRKGAKHPDDFAKELCLLNSD